MFRKPIVRKKTQKETIVAPKPGNHCVVVLPDIHFPEQDPVALEIVLKVLEYLKPQRLVFTGDVLDCGPFSEHAQKSFIEIKAHDFKRDEIDPANAFLDRAQKHAYETIFEEGNHEWRVERAAVKYGKMLQSVYDLISPRTLLSANRKNFTYIPYIADAPITSHYKITPNLWALHGVTHAKHAASVTLDKLLSVSCVFGHIHRAQSHVRRNPITGEAIQVWSPGCLSKLQPIWRHPAPTDWVHGFSIIYCKNDLTEWTAYNPIITNGSVVLPDGRSIKA